MRNLQDVPNIGGVSPANPDGKIIDEASPIIGTGVTEILYNDPIQLFHKLKRLSSITPNGLPDDEINGFQLLTALFAQSLPQWYPTTDKVDFSKTKFVVYNNGIYYHKTTVNTNNNPSVDTTNWFQVFYWNGLKIVFSNDIDIAQNASDIAQNASDIAQNTSDIAQNTSDIAAIGGERGIIVYEARIYETTNGVTNSLNKLEHINTVDGVSATKIISTIDTVLNSINLNFSSIIADFNSRYTIQITTNFTLGNPSVNLQGGGSNLQVSIRDSNGSANVIPFFIQIKRWS